MIERLSLTALIYLIDLSNSIHAPLVLAHTLELLESIA